jgi:hypothetical protein
MLQSVLRTAGAFTIAAGFALAAHNACAEQWVFERIIQTGDTLPFDNSAVITSLNGASIEHGNLTYSGNAMKNAATMDFIAARINGINRTVATEETDVPDGIGLFSFLSGSHIDDDCVVFTGRDSGRGGPAHTGVYRYHPAAKLHAIADVSTPVPQQPGAVFTNFFSAFADNGIVSTYADINPVDPPSERAILRDDAGFQTLPFVEDMPLPGGETVDTFEGFDYREDATALRIRTNAGPRGVYLFNNNGNQRIASEGDFVPDGAIGEVFSVINASPVVDYDGEMVAFSATGDMGTTGLFTKNELSTLELAISNADMAPPASPNHFSALFNSPAIDHRALVFRAQTTENANQNLYTTLGGSTKLVLAVGDMLDGKTVANVGSVSRQAISASTIILSVSFDDASEGIYTATLTQEMMETEPNNSPETANCVEILSDCVFISGKLQPNEFPECDPDTVLVAFDKFVNFLEDGSGIRLINDDDSPLGDGRASALWDIPFVVAGDGSETLRLGVTGAGDVVEGMGGNNGDFNGLLANAPHEQLGEFTLTVTFVDDQDMPLDSPAMLPDGSFIENPIDYVEEFRSGGEAFYINYPAPIGAAAAHAVIDNTTGRIDACNDVDFFEFKNLIPNCPYCIVQIGGLDEQCAPTDGQLAWYDKDFNIIITDDNSGDGVYAALCNPNLPVVADINGVIRIAFTGSGDDNFNGLADGPDEDDYLIDNPDYALEYPGLNSFLLNVGGGITAGSRLDIVCADPPPAHGVCGCYTLKVFLDVDAHDALNPPLVTIDEALIRGDINMDGTTDTADLGILLGYFGWSAP